MLVGVPLLSLRLLLHEKLKLPSELHMWVATWLRWDYAWHSFLQMAVGSETAEPAPVDSQSLSRVYKSNRSMGEWVKQGFHINATLHWEFSWSYSHVLCTKFDFPGFIQFQLHIYWYNYNFPGIQYSTNNSLSFHSWSNWFNTLKPHYLTCLENLLTSLTHNYLTYYHIVFPATTKYSMTYRPHFTTTWNNEYNFMFHNFQL